MKRTTLYQLFLVPALLLMALLMAWACASKAPALVEEVPAIEEAPPQEEEPEADDVILVSQEMYDDTLAEVKLFVDNLNSMIHDKNYTGWKNTLSDEFYNHISSVEFLANASDSPLLKSKKIILKTPNDYFLQVVVPARSHSQVDEIEFAAMNRVKVYYLETAKKGNNGTETDPRRLRLYELEKDGDIWKIIN